MLGHHDQPRDRLVANNPSKCERVNWNNNADRFYHRSRRNDPYRDIRAKNDPYSPSTEIEGSYRLIQALSEWRSFSSLIVLKWTMSTSSLIALDPLLLLFTASTLGRCRHPLEHQLDDTKWTHNPSMPGRVITYPLRYPSVDTVEVNRWMKLVPWPGVLV